MADNDHFGRGGDSEIEKLRVLYIGAHPDDDDLDGGGTAMRLVANGAVVRFCAVANGGLGHQSMPASELVPRRTREASESASALGVESYGNLDFPDGRVEPTLELRERLTREIRSFRPDVIVTHRTCDYHPDHRAVGRAVLDTIYMVGVPQWCPDAPIPPRVPVVLHFPDVFTDPRPMKPDILVDVSACMDTWALAVAHHESQLFEWLPVDRCLSGVPSPDDAEAVRAFVMRYWGYRKADLAKRFASEWNSRNPGTPVPAYVEAFEISEYGRRPSSPELSFFGIGSNGETA